MAVVERFTKKRILYSILVPPLAFAPAGILLFLLGIEVSIIRDIWYLSIFISCVMLARRDGTSLSQIGLSKRNLGQSLLLATAWELVTFFSLGIVPFYAIAGRLPTLTRFEWSVITQAIHFMLVGLSEETWVRGLLLKRLTEWKPKGLAPVMWSSMIFVLFHLPATFFIIVQDTGTIPLLIFSWLSLLIWSAGLAVVVLKTGNLLGPIVVHWLDDLVSKVLYPLQL